MRRIILTFTVAGTLATAVVAASPATDDFEAFRRGLLQNQSSFRDDLLGNYAKFLDSAWEEFDRFKAESRNPAPKPVTPPAVVDDGRAPAKLPVPEIVAPAAPVKPMPRPAVEPAPKPAVTSQPVQGESVMDFYGLEVKVPRSSLRLQNRLADGSAFAAQWRTFLADPTASDIADGLAAAALGLGLNDYLTFDLVRRYVDQSYPGAHSSARASLTHYIMASLGFDVRIAMSDGEGLLLVPTQQTVYGRPYMVMDGRKYYVFADNISSGGRISTCRLPADAETGRAMDMHITAPLTPPVAPQPFALEFGDIKLSGQLNKNIYPMLYHYPQTDMEVYVTSVIDPQLRADLVAQLSEQLAGRPTLDAVNELLRFTQSAIDYATDDTAHGFEKPYFLEEWLYYPQNDCEDRAVFYTYMLWNVLGVECQMITYPGHESAAVCLDSPISGDNYTAQGRTFYISDPTYIGAETGQCMPDFLSTTPQIEYHYHK